MNRVAEILEEKGRQVFEIDAEASIFEAAQEMVVKNIGSLLVTQGGEIAGIVTERDFLRHVALEGSTDGGAAVREVMSTQVVVVTPDTPIDECMALMTDRRMRHLPVVADGEVV